MPEQTSWNISLLIELQMPEGISDERFFEVLKELSLKADTLQRDILRDSVKETDP